MIKKLIVLFGILFCGSLYGAQIVNVEYIHNAIKQKWDITVPYNAELSNPRVAANMKYLLTAIDVANEMLNGSKTTAYGTGAYATTVAADTVATNTAVESLVKKEFSYPLVLKVTYPSSHIFSFKLSAAGAFYIDWGDSTKETIEKTDTTTETISHEYWQGMPTPITIKIGGVATGYPKSSVAAIDFRIREGSFFPQTRNNNYLLETSGCLGCVFPTLSDGTQPSFYHTFEKCTSLRGGIPDGFFDGITGMPTNNMFASTFKGCTALTGPSARIGGQYLYEIWPNATSMQVGGMYNGCTGLDDYANIPDAWK